MIEPEMAFATLEDDMKLSEELIKYLISDNAHYVNFR